MDPQVKLLRRLMQGVCVAAFIYLFFFQVYYAFNFTVDDAFISMRYAKHLSAGKGLLWNLTEPPIEGYSNFSYVLLMSLFFKMGMPVLVTVKLFSLAALLVSFYLLYRVSLFFLPHSLSLVPSFLMLFHRGEILWAVSGLETSFYQLLILLVVYLILRGLVIRNKTPFVAAGLVMAVAGITRPEAPLLCLVFLLGIGLCAYRNTNRRRQFELVKSGGLYLASFLVCYIPYFVWRWHYFGKLFPNPVYCKAMFSSVPGYVDFQYVLLLLPLLVMTIPLLLYSRKTIHYFLIAPSFAYLVAFFHADVVVAYMDRFFLPVFVLILPLFVSGLYTLFSLEAFKLSKNRRLILTAVVAVSLSLFVLPIFTRLSFFNYYGKLTEESTAMRLELGQWLKMNLADNEKASVGDCGLIPYVSERTIIDSYCLNSREMTEPPIALSYQRFTDWLVHTEQPKYIILLALTLKNKAFYPPFDLLALKSLEFESCYTRIKRFATGDTHYGYYYDVYEKRC